MKVFVCQSCGHIEFSSAPNNCPICWKPKEQFKQNDNIFKESMEKSKEAAVKHIPSVKVNKSCGLIPENTCTDIIIRIGEVLHPMTAEHYINFIDVYQDGKYIQRLFLTPNVEPAGCIHLKNAKGKITVVESCTIHGYWMTEQSI
ncbi:MAG: hypothetical protein A2Y40_04890 [Candidatus Margulisbacteria bacterium GWF2_35_9]|nr:MAG: hypothetical protein A2Y40_04890 [Candidatus Margulisbacteria bacterium GWF2_35_9]